MDEMGTITRNRLGFAVNVLRRPSAKGHDGRRWQSDPHLRVSLGYLHEVFAILHHRANNPGRMDAAEACRGCLATWPHDQMPKIHYSSQRVAHRHIVRRTHSSGERVMNRAAPKPG